jgi:cell division protein FtsI (penicillin-binding protein 3)
MAKPAARLAFLQVLLGLGAVAVVGRAFTVQVVQHDAWSKRAEDRDILERPVEPRRGGIFDRDMMPLAATYEAYHVEVAVNELEDVAAARRLIEKSLGVSAEHVARQFRGPYPYFDGPFDAMQVQSIRSLKGIHLQPLLGREHPMGTLARPLVGRTDRESGRGIEGIELGLDSLLVGTPGKERVLLDGGGRIVPIPGAAVIEPKPGHDVLLTIDHELQGIAEGALERAVDEFNALGGDVVILDVHSGEVLAIASLRTKEGVGGPVPTTSALVEPNEPGSTAKIFTAGAAILHRVDTGVVSGEGGVWQMPVASGGRTRTIVDVHRVDGMLDLSQTIQVSSNIAISKFAQRLEGHQQYELLRAFGFGTQPGTGFPGEAPGFLDLPSSSPNLNYTRPSWGQGYEFSVSALQMASAYAAIANGGTLLAPTLVREIRESPSGKVLWRHRPDTVRRAVPPEVAAKLLEFLRLAVDSGGTGGGAQLDRWEVLGKTGTAKLAPGVTEYRGAFAGIFPGNDPRFVLYVMLDRPRGSGYYGGIVAAPIVRNMLVQALALPDSPLEPGRDEQPAPRRTPPANEVAALPLRRVSLPLKADSGRAATGVAIPDLAGWRVREGLHAVHQRGLKVRLVGDGRIVRTQPVAGDTLTPGSTLTVYAELRR